MPVQQDQELWVPGTPEVAGGRWWQMGCGGNFLGGGGAEDMEECDISPLKSPLKPSTSETATATSNFSNPLVFKC